MLLFKCLLLGQWHGLSDPQLEAHGLKLKEAETAIVDATLIKSAARPNKILETVAQDREEDKTDCEITESLAKDPDARWVKKRRKSKAFPCRQSLCV